MLNEPRWSGGNGANPDPDRVLRGLRSAIHASGDTLNAQEEAIRMIYHLADDPTVDQNADVWNLISRIAEQACVPMLHETR